ncbi:MAG: nucleoside hydrolase [Bryobacterales bacterium]|nr:nucleoside hydrolase [Bryobacteraceae bacterium]MDW8129280.1 nucleoside hydrolase [Bryobacterales bacterium]
MLALSFLLVLVASCVRAQQPLPVILDTDIGDDIDDALALAFALQSPELDVRAIVTVLQHRGRRADLVWKILQLYGREDIPIGMGAEQPLLAPARHGEVPQTAALTAGDRLPDTRRRNGIELYFETCLKSSRKVTILAYGPLTNVALALKAEPRLAERIERLVLMNGVFFSPRLEYNTLRDPEAAAIVFSSGLPIVSVGLDVTMRCQLERRDLDRLAASGLPAVRFLGELIRIWQEGRPDRRPILHDPLAVAVAFRGDLVKLQRGRVEVETRGSPDRTYGMTLFRPDPRGPVEVASDVEVRPFLDLFMERLLQPPRALAR